MQLRAIATLPWEQAGELAITADRRFDLAQALPFNALAGAVTTLSRRRGADLRAADWTRGPNCNALAALSYSTVIAAPGGGTALSAEVMMALPTTMNSSVITCAEARITDFPHGPRPWRHPVRHPARTCSCRRKR